MSFKIVFDILKDNNGKFRYNKKFHYCQGEIFSDSDLVDDEGRSIAAKGPLIQFQGCGRFWKTAGNSIDYGFDWYPVKFYHFISKHRIKKQK